jgi:hypothetical protein
MLDHHSVLVEASDMISLPIHSRFGRFFGGMLLVLLGLGLAGCVGGFGRPVAGAISTASPAGGAAAGPVVIPFTLDGGRIYVPVRFQRPDGGVREALAWANFGVGGMTLSPALHQELGGGAVAFTLGGAPVRVEKQAILASTADSFAQLGPLPVEAVLPAGLWPRFRVTINYPARTLTLEPPTAASAPGVAVPIAVNRKTGLMAVRAGIAGRDYPVVLDAGAGYSWMRGADVRGWLASHPDWYRADGALGAANQAMSGENVEQLGAVVRVPAVRLGDLSLTDVGVLGTGPGGGHPLDQVKESLLWKLWGQGAPYPVVGWIGANAMAPYRITFDYQNGVSYWLKTGQPDRGELGAVGVALAHGTKNYFIGAIVSLNGRPAVSGVEVGDRLLAIDGRPAPPMSRGAIMRALRGEPGTVRRLTLERKGVVIEVEATVIGVDGPVQ